ncbi:Maf family protein [Thiolapillus brandeum]|uniref:7-methyl-GTP pyrophosphatase n=1 Tax=Thiolapillus brandeum TaxID=1076588 RepID=A0A7U6JHL7_9GAMM|nr:nucleoside triphosphate pyrophosphatase [Thiolapillus brandeum]BAO44466.1 septum formation protein Maf [Thiolapillus brandeum]
MLELVLGSTSPFRRELLEKLGLPFSTAAPDVDETHDAGETPQQLVRRLAEAKARAVSGQHPNALIIGSDQVACVDEQILGKPGSRDKATRQLNTMSGKTVTFHTGLCLYNSQADRVQVSCEPYRVHFRTLDSQQIARYVDKEQPYNCAGSFKSEGLGITLFRKLEGDDPNILVGLPLIRLVEMLDKEGVVLP